MSAGISQLSWFFLFAFALHGTIAIAILIFKNKSFKTANLLLGINLLGICMIAFVITVVESGMILSVPHFYRLPSPLYYLMFPAAYLYVKTILSDRSHLQKKDYLHFIPAFVHLIEMLPFYFQRAEEKILIIKSVVSQHIDIYAHNEGWLPPFAHNLIRGTMAIIYAIAMWRLIRKSNANQMIKDGAYKSTLRWLKVFTVVNAIIGIAVICFLTFQFIAPDVRSMALSIVFLLLLTIVSFFLFFRPEILYGLPQPAMMSNSSQINTEEPVHSDGSNLPEAPVEIPAFIFDYKHQVNQYLLTSKRYLTADLKLHDLAREAGIPRHHLQLLIHKAEGKKFNEFINDYRIHHIRNLIENGDLKQKTLEALAAESGFSSRATFIRTVKKITGMTPSEYFHIDQPNH
ncbi:MAG: helix-turn-helix transcriptional regulator [Cyclobacteriaceae bacterium]|nr:helix-turn-helix transcriptional regulator [Cyclobacteriaceae bacterium]